jgi:WD40 repeat protein
MASLLLSATTMNFDGLSSLEPSPRAATIAILWDVASRKPIGEPLKAYSEGVRSVAFSPDGKTLATGSHDGTGDSLGYE